MEKEILVFLLQRHVAGTLTEDERTELATYVNKKQNKETITSTLEGLLSQYNSSRVFDETRFLPLISGILNADSIDDDEIAEAGASKEGSKGSARKKVLLIIFILLIVGAAAGYIYYYKPFTPAKVESANKPLATDAAPGGNKAILTVSDGSTFALDSLKSGIVAQQGNVRLIKAANGELQYKPSSEMTGSILYNTLTTPRGGQCEILLSDGSRIKLNSFSSITYPVFFTGTERSVMITGEAYFEIVENSKMPFKVMAYDMEVEVQSTEFNVNSYIDEPAVKTTLIKGSLKLKKDSENHVLQPMQQGQFDKEGKYSLEKEFDPKEVTAWRDGLFEFNNTDLKTVMRQLSRWYDVEIIYETGSPVDQQISGEIKRNVPLSEVVKLLEKNNVHCRIEGKTVFVMP